MSHPHIVRFLGAFMQSGAAPALCILLEFAAGGTLRHDIRRQRKKGQSYESDDVIVWMTQLVTAVSYMHGRNVLHRDLSSGESTVSLRRAKSHEETSLPACVRTCAFAVLCIRVPACALDHDIM